MARRETAPTIKDVARMAGVSVGTVSRYLNGGHARSQNAERIDAAVSVLGYRPNVLGRYLVTGSPRTVGVLVPRAANVFAATILSGLQLAFEEAGYAVVVIDYQGSPELLRKRIWGQLLSGRVDGLVVLTSELARGEYAFLADVDIPLVVIDNPLDAPGVDSVVVDNRSASRRLVGAMLDAGHERAGLVGMRSNTHVGRERRLGWEDAYRERGLAVPESLALEAEATKDAGSAMASRLVSRGNVTTIFAANYYLALGSLCTLARLGLRVGVDIGFATFDDYGFGDVFVPALSTVRQPTAEIARTAADLLVRRIKGADDRPSQVSLVQAEVRVTDSVRGGLWGEARPLWAAWNKPQAV